MAGFDYDEYVRLFASGNDDALCDRFFTEDAVMQTETGLYEGRTALREFLRGAHDGVREILRPQIVVADDDHLLAEIDIDFRASADRPGFVFGALRAGEVITVKFFVVYTLRGGRVCYLKTARWPPGRATSAPGPA
jgi:hypothetical protein